ncbi:choice-of-anchor X domain-containing protein [Massilia pseudoviolaceinigra]|uniref:choice-of-anchor X domain-containing protein n=1 Tax=Massilia pseudoviolaceinigra TaxID=3057165 RepID=UPI0027964637|nr:choice-of-anchor X domain-containing protein [Massilia sp. CCM 9206]MDQ1919431.1 choice-of-anchor X domain-containing protein [Massilia sp. CCM 9206]
MAATLALLAWRSGAPAGAAASAAPPAPDRTAATFVAPRPQGALLPPVSGRGAQLQQLREQLALADKTLCDYRAATRYPDLSRPMSEQPDQVYPNQPVTETHAMRSEGGRADPSVQIQTSQSRVFMVAGETVALSLRALDSRGAVQPLVITRALAQGITFKGARPTTQLPLAFADDGQMADAVAGDGAFGAILAPAQTGLAAFHGTIRTEVRFSVNGRAGVVLFDIVYSPEVPATWTGQIREAIEDGSLVYYLKADVRKAGRYVVSGRVDDAAGKPFALATFNDMLGAGQTEVKLTVFGKLLRDQAPALPLTLRDVDGYLLRENTDPDRLMMPRMEGRAFTGKPHALKDFSDAEWQSETRTRHLEEFGKDVALARGALAEADPGAPAPASACIR